MNTLDEPANKQLKWALETVRQGVIAGAAGGLTEIAWVTLYAGVTGSNAVILARGVTTAAGVSAGLRSISSAAKNAASCPMSDLLNPRASR